MPPVMDKIAASPTSLPPPLATGKEISCCGSGNSGNSAGSRGGVERKYY